MEEEQVIGGHGCSWVGDFLARWVGRWRERVKGDVEVLGVGGCGCGHGVCGLGGVSLCSGGHGWGKG